MRRFMLLLPMLTVWTYSLAQIVHLTGGASNISGTDGASVTVFENGAETRIGMGYIGGVRLGVSRTVSTRSFQMILGNSTSFLSLPTDMPDAQRFIAANGVLLRKLGKNFSAEIFHGTSGRSYGNAFFSSVDMGSAMVLGTAKLVLGRTDLHALVFRGERSALLTSAGFHLSRQTSLAIAAGLCAGKPVLSTGLHHQGSSWKIDATFTSGHILLQPEKRLDDLRLERIGLNVMASKQIGQRVWIDAARHEYATASQDLPDTPGATTASGNSLATLGDRSVLMEGGLTLRTGKLQSGVRLLHSGSGTMQDSGLILIEAWRMRRWNTQAMLIRRTDATGQATLTAQFDAEERLHRRLQLRQGLTLGTGVPAGDVGGSLEGNWGSLGISHAETFIPFGTQRGFQRTLTISMALHLHNGEVGLQRVSASGIHSIYLVNADDFEGSDTGTWTNVSHGRLSTISQYLLEGLVLEGNLPVRGAAVLVGEQMVYTDSEGRWLARFSKKKPVRVTLQPSEFLTAQPYHAVSEAIIATPGRAPTPPVNIQAERCHAGELHHHADPAPPATGLDPLFKEEHHWPQELRSVTAHMLHLKRWAEM